MIPKTTFSSCNHCARKNCKGINICHVDCPIWIDPAGKIQMAELLLYHPQTTHDTLSAMPFKVNLDFHLHG